MKNTETYISLPSIDNAGGGPLKIESMGRVRRLNGNTIIADGVKIIFPECLRYICHEGECLAKHEFGIK